MSQRCQNKCKLTNRKCKLHTYNQYGKKFLCHIHAKCLLSKYILLIQKCYIGYRTRRKLNHLYYNLPEDLQHHILSYIREPHYIMRYHKSISNILLNRYNIIFPEDYFYYNKIYSYENNNMSFYYKIYQLYTLYCKYFSIIPHKFTSNLYYKLNDILCQLTNHVRMTNSNEESNLFNIMFCNILRLYKVVFEDKNHIEPSNKIFLHNINYLLVY